MPVESFLHRLGSLGRKPWAVPAGLGIAILLAYGVFIPWLGFYWDDWPTAWFNYLQGPAVYWKVYADVRPVLPWTYMLTTPWLGTHPQGWQLFGMLARWLAVVSAWSFLRNLWPDRRREAAVVAIVLALYPGFKQGPIPIIYSHFFLLMALSCLSLAAMVRAVREPRRQVGFTLVSLATAALSIFSTEYFAGLELLRPLVLWIVLGQQGDRGVRRVRGSMILWIPFATLFMLYLGWRVWVLGFSSYQPRLLEGIGSQAGTALGALMQTIGRALWTATVLAWGQGVVFPMLSEVGRKFLLGYAAALAAIGGWSLVYLVGSGEEARPGSDRNRRGWPLQALALGLVAMLGGGVPIWITQLPVSVDYPWDRMTLPLMLGACLVLVGIVEFIARPTCLRIGIVAGVLALSAGVHYQSNMTYVHEAEALGTFLWQLSWRIPGLERGTTVLTNDLPLRYYSDNSLTAPLNWMYAPDDHSLQMDYMLYYPTVRVGLALSEPEAGLPIHQAYRAAQFEGSTSQLLALYYSPPGCVHVLDVVLDDSMPNLPASLSAWVPLSRLDRIRTDAQEPALPPLYPDEPAHDWCYYFEKADLARQRGDWQAVAELGDQAFAVDHPNDPSERLVFIEGYAHVDRLDRAEELSYAALEQNPAVNRMLCHTWERLLRELDAGEEGRAAAGRVGAAAGCADA